VKTRILLTIGDFNGIGPEIVIKTLSVPAVVNKFDLTVVSPVSVMEFYAKRLGRKIFAHNFNIIPCGYEKLRIKPGHVSDEAGFIAGLAVVKAAELCMNGEYDAIVTAPLSKEALNRGGFNYDGHTGMLCDFGKAKDVCMFMVSQYFKTALATTHPPLRKVSSLVNKKMLQSKLKICFSSLKKDFMIPKPKIAVLSINPHAGEGGVIGKEEIEIISPSVRSMGKKYGVNAFSGPFAADGFFASRSFKKFDLTFAMYHDQGLIPFKMLAGMNGINYTAGLKFVRTSPDHGTAFDIAGKNKASNISFIQAVKWADKIYRNRNNQRV
jgi:4-hydroxythreonine-4-phosphate dehydrogenase